VLEGKVAVVTGAGGGIGSATALELARAGAAVVLVGRTAAGLEATRQRLSGHDRVLVHVADVTSVDAMADAFAEAMRAFGAVDVLFNAAGVTGRVSPVARESEANFDALFAGNVKGTWASIRGVIPIMKEAQRGSIVNCASALGLIGSAGMASYSASKHAVVGLTRSLAIELAPRGIRVNVVCPGPTETPMLDDLRAQGRSGPARHEAHVGDPAIRRVADPLEIARTVVFLASDQAESITGAVVSIDGGIAAGR
jgi:NAD(P)-dependent dehydrogenase (short-subunit alcohol dehydrogenase family)